MESNAPCVLQWFPMVASRKWRRATGRVLDVKGVTTLIKWRQPTGTANEYKSNYEGFHPFSTINLVRAGVVAPLHERPAPDGDIIGR